MTRENPISFYCKIKVTMMMKIMKIIIVIIIIIKFSLWPWNIWVGIQQGITMFHGQVKPSSALIGNHIEMVSQ